MSSPSPEVFIAPASHQQQRLWFLDRLVEGSPFYNVPTAARLRGPLDVKCLTRALNRVVARHESLRTTFAFDDGHVVQCIREELQLELAKVDLRPGSNDPADRDALELRVARIAMREARRPFDLEAGPLVRASLLKLGSEEHVLLLTLHHIVADGWSLGLLLRDVAELYRAESSGRVPALPELPIQYADYAEWQREQLQGEALEREVAFWRDRLAALPKLELPTDHPRPQVPSFRGAVESFTLSTEIGARVAELCRSEAATPFMVLAAGFALLLGRQAGQREIALGTPVAHRRRTELENLIGFFVNTLVLRVQLDPAASFQTLLRAFRRECLTAYDHQDVPFELLVEALEPERDLGRNPLFQVMVVLLNMPSPSESDAELLFEPLHADSGTAKFDLQLFLSERSGRWHASVEYSTDLFDADTIRSWMARFEHLLDQLTANPHVPLRELDLLTDAERTDLVKRWNATATAFDLESSLTTRIERTLQAHAERTLLCMSQLDSELAMSRPHAPAPQEANARATTLTGAELERRANQLAHELIARGVRPEDRVGICLERSLELMIGLVAILKAGAAYVPLEPELPPARIDAMCASSDVSIVLTRGAETERGSASSAATWLDLDLLEAALAARPAVPPQRRDHPAQLAYVIFTSGSTGRPKGVGVSHRAIVNRLLWMQAAFPIDTTDHVLQKTPIGFDVSVWELFWPLITGARLVLAPPGAQRDPAQLCDLIHSEGITTLHFVPSLLRVFLECERARSLTSLRHVFCSGEALTSDLVSALQARTETEVVNLYGPTEAAVDVTVWRCSRNSPHDSEQLAAPPIGHPIANIQTYVLDDEARLVPPGVLGELYLGGVGLARGYVNQPGLSAERFVPDPFGNAPGARLYRTGDRVFQDPTGAIHYLGRIDHQVKLHGQRIELGEIETCLRGLSGVRDAVVVRRDDPERLVAYVRGEPRASDEAVASATCSLSTEEIEAVSHWEQLYDDLYSAPAGADPRPSGTDALDETPPHDTRGWISSYTQTPYPAAAMAEWIEECTRSLRSFTPRTVIEIGCGNGLLLRQLAPTCDRYIGTDLSQSAIDALASEVASWPGVELHAQPAHVPPQVSKPVDLVILNSVVQYFPSYAYLITVLEQALQKLRPGGILFVGDVRALPWLSAFHADVLLERASPVATATRLANELESRVKLENELVLDPYALAAQLGSENSVARVEVRLKPGHQATEMNAFRCDLIVYRSAGDEVDTVAPVQETSEPTPRVLEWSPTLELTRVIADVRPSDTEPPEPQAHSAEAPGREGRAAPHSVTVVRGIPNRRLSRAFARLESVQAAPADATTKRLRELAEHRPEEGWDPGELVKQARDRAADAIVWVEPSDPRRFAACVFASEPQQRRSFEPARLAPLAKPHPLATPDAAAASTAVANDPLRERKLRAWMPELRRALAEELPHAWIPAQLVPLDTWPLTLSGKLDRKALPNPGAPVSLTHFLAPESREEQILAELWSEILGVDRVGLDDGFFELGGDSIASIQLVQRARQRGLELKPRQVFEHPTLRQLAAAAGTLARIHAPQTPYVGAIGWIPIARRFREWAKQSPHHWNQAILLSVPKQLDLEALSGALRTIVDHHDALRIRLHGPSLSIAPVDSDVAVLDRQELAPGAADSTRQIEQACSAFQTTLDLAHGPVFRALHLSLPDHDEDRLLLTAHHLCVDTVSWRILIEDLASAYLRLEAGEPIRLPPRTTPYAHWVERLYAWGRSSDSNTGEDRRARASMSSTEVLPQLPTDFPRTSSVGSAGDNGTEASTEYVRVTLDAQTSQGLLSGAARAYRMRADEVVLAAFARALANWTGRTTFEIELESHGRTDILDDVDVSRTVGWFTAQFPVRVEVSAFPNIGASTSASANGEADPARGEVASNADLEADLCRVKEAVRAVPHGGLSHGVAYALTEANALGTAPVPELGFNYFGRLELSAPEDLPVRGAPEAVGNLRAPDSLRPYLLDLNASLQGGEIQLRFGFSRDLHARATIDALSEQTIRELRAAARWCSRHEVGRRTVSDFPLAELDDRALGLLCAAYPQLEQAYPLTPLQAGLWWHSRLSETSDRSLYVVQLRFELCGPLDLEDFRAAWVAVIQRHSTLRSAVTDVVGKPLQIVVPANTAPLKVHDWSNLTELEQEGRLHAWLVEDRARGFALADPPLQRLSLLRLGVDRSVLVWTHHHLILDGWSIPVVLREVLAHYDARRRNVSLALPAPRPFSDYVAWVKTRDLDRARQFWTHELRGLDAPTPLPIPLSSRTAPSPQPVGAPGAHEPEPSAATQGMVLRHTFEIAGARFRELASCARSHQLTLNTLLECAWALLLARHAGLDDVVFGVTVAGRPADWADPEACVGMFIQTLPIRVKLPDARPVAAWLADHQQRAAHSRDEGALSLVEIAQVSDIPRGTPLFESLLAFENYPVESAAAAGPAELELASFHYADRTHYPLALVVSPGPDALRFELVADAERIPATALARLEARLDAILHRLATQPHACLGTHTALAEDDADEFESCLDRSELQTSPSVPPTHREPRVEDAVASVESESQLDPRMHAGVEHNARRRPHAVALVAPDGNLTYAELYERARALADRLVSLGVRTEERVAVVLPRSCALPVAIVGVLEAGGAYVPLDPELPQARLEQLLADCAPRCIVTSPELESRVCKSGAAHILLPDPGEPTTDSLIEATPPAAEPAVQPTPSSATSDRVAANAPFAPDALAYVIYTSGSTGSPKGVAVSHRQVARLLEVALDHFDFTPDDVWSVFHSTAFDFSVWELFMAWHTGARAILWSDDVRRSPDAFLDGLSEHRVTVLDQVPSAFYALASTQAKQPRDLSSLRWLIFGGENLDPSRIAEFALAQPRTRIANMYGITETTVHVTFHEVTHAELDPPPTSIGRPLRDLDAFVLDPSLRPVPTGAIGELHVAGPGLARGYLGAPGRTAERFVPHPSPRTPGERIYRTGDLVCRRADGSLEYHGRTDLQIQLRGHRIELGEVEAALRAHPAVHAACVLHDTRPPGRLVACIEAAEPMRADIENWLRERLPAYMLPRELRFHDALPITSNGKLDRRALHSSLLTSTESGFREPTTDTEKLLARIWCELLGVARIGAEDDFFQLGGHSLIAAQLVKRVEIELGVDLDLRVLFGATRLDELAARIDTQREASTSALDRIEALLDDLEDIDG